MDKIDVIEFMKPYTAITAALMFIFGILMVVFGILQESSETNKCPVVISLYGLIVSLVVFLGSPILWGLLYVVLEIINLFIEAF